MNIRDKQEQTIVPGKGKWGGGMAKTHVSLELIIKEGVNTVASLSATRAGINPFALC